MQLRAFSFSLPSLPKRRFAAAFGAVCVHAGLAIFIFSVKHDPVVPVSVITDIVIVAEPDEELSQLPEPDEVTETAAIAPGPQPETTASPVASLPALPPVSARAGETEAADTEPESNLVYPISPGTRSVLQGLQCPGDPDAFARTGLCPQGAGPHTAMAAADESAADFITLDTGTIRSMFGLAPHALAGQAALDGGTQRTGLANSDSIRDALPASQPDPAFGD
ncbi:hypothetical protein V0U79_08515 [Hyphobacterium sp. HN65]|uniref:Uncharacterized protein n=1 Tax=Hyphobacterium lacteum TaxID=3116575 RepID=A0ABU7LR64_9PROT|nr:hypothetical protein [Hyphobacterium sp. HN65]MEE2526407.1 hypothetical protein [Hyphobacterium sp. HN65]